MSTQILPWADLSKAPPSDLQVPPGHIQQSLYQVCGPWGLKAYVLASSGHAALEAACVTPSSMWEAYGVTSDLCSAELMGHTSLPKREWSHLLADIDSPVGLVIKPSS